MVIFYSILTIVLEGSKLDFSNDGIFGGLRPENIPINILNAALAGFWGVLGYQISLLYFSPLIVMNCLLIEPLTGQILGVILAVDHTPGPLTWIGVLFIMVAINILANEKDKKDKEVEND